MALIRHQVAATDTAKQTIAQTYEQLAEEVQAFEGSVQEMLGTWAGDASQTFNECQMEWQTGMREAGEVLQRLGVKVDQAQGDLIDVETRSANRFA